jgi:hypothetical protein
LSIVVEVAAPGLLVVKHAARPTIGEVRERRGSRGRSIKVVDESAVEPAGLPAVADVAARIHDCRVVVGRDHSVNVLWQLAVSMRVHGPRRLMLLSSETPTGRNRSSGRSRTAVAPAFAELARCTRGCPSNGRALWQDAVEPRGRVRSPG